MRPEMRDGLHVVHGDSAGGTVASLGAAHVRVRRDLLTLGPCDVDPARHRALRAEHWGIDDAEAADGLLGVGDLGAAIGLAAADAPIVLWATAAWSDRCFLWCTLDALERLGVPRQRVWVVQPGGDEVSSSGAYEAAEMRQALDLAIPLDEGFASEGAALWRLYAGASPIGFDEMRRRGSPSYPELGRIAEAHAAWFPWRDGERVRLSDVDAMLLGWLADHWLGTRDLVLGPRGTSVVERLFAVVGDLGVLMRLDAWRALGAIELEQPELGSWEGVRARITAAGARLRDDGAATVEELAPIWIGGCLINDPSAPFVRAPDGSLTAA
jgi:hypothetical protein